MFESLFLAPSQSKALPNQDKAKQCRNQSIALDDQLTLGERVFKHLEATAGGDQASAYAQAYLKRKGLGKNGSDPSANGAAPNVGEDPRPGSHKPPYKAPISQRGYEAFVDEKEEK